MALDEARDDDAPGKVDPFRAGVFRASGQPRPHVRDGAVFDEYVRVQDVPRWVHGDDGCVGEQCTHVFSPVVDRGVTLWLAAMMSGGGGCPEAGTQGSLPGSAVRRPSRKNSGWRGVRKGAGRTLPGGPYSAYYAVSCDNGMCVPLPAGPGPSVSRVGILRPPRPFSACGPSPPPCTVWLFFQDRLRQALRSRKPGGSALCWLFERLSRVILKEFLMRCIEKTLYTNGRIVTMDAAGTVAEAVLVAGNVIEAVGSKDGLAALAGPAAGPSTSRARPSTPASSTRTATPRCTPCGKRTAAVRASRTSRTCTP